MESVTQKLMLTVVFIVLSVAVLIQLCTAAKIQSNTDDTTDNYTRYLRQSLSNATAQIGEDVVTPTSLLELTTVSAANHSLKSTIISTITSPTPSPIVNSSTPSGYKSNGTPPSASPADGETSITKTTTPFTNITPFTKTCPKTKFENYTLPETIGGSWATPEGAICLNEDSTSVRIHCLENGVWNLTEGITCSRQNISETTTISSSTDTTETLSRPSIETCNETNVGNYTLPETNAGSWAIPEGVICLNEDYTPVRVQCLNKGVWDLPHEITCPQYNISKTTKNLHNIVDEIPVTAINETMNIIQKNKSELKAIDIHFISQILSKASKDDEIAANPKTFLGIINQTMSVQQNVLALSQELLNATDTILYSLDQLLLKSRRTVLKTSNLLVHTITINKSEEIYGAIVTNNDSEEVSNFLNFNIEYLNRSNYEDVLSNKSFEIAFVIPPKAINSSDRYFITMFYNDNLFTDNQEKKSEIVGSWIISILFPRKVRTSSIKIYYKELQINKSMRQCEHWKYGIENSIAIAGKWSSDGNATKFKEGYYICEFNHTTHFGMLVSGSLPDNFFLDLITIFGSALSVFGIIIILLTALVFKQWRNKANSKILLNVSLCLLMLIILFIVADRINEGLLCKIVGVLLHYMVLAQFCWSLTISYSSFRRFHTVSNDHINHVLLKFCGFSWGVPSIVVIVTAILNLETYNKNASKNSSEICYPKEMYLKFGVCLPMAVILAINVVIYILIVKHLLITNKLDIRKHETKKSLSVQKSLILLFFMMSITWVFGFVVAFTDNTIFLYLFCTTATLHGFAIFLFYILDSAEIKQLWKNKLKQIRTKSKQGKNINRHNHRIEENITESISR